MSNTQIREAIEYVDLLLEDLEADEAITNRRLPNETADLLEFIREVLREQLSV